MTKEKSLSEKDFEAYLEVFQGVGNFLEGSPIFELWQMVSKKKEVTS